MLVRTLMPSAPLSFNELFFQVEFKPEWIVDLRDVPACLEANGSSVHDRKCVEALQQIYGYMTFNNNKFGILSNLTRSWFFRRVGDGRTLHHAGPINHHTFPGSPSILKAYVGIILLEEKDFLQASDLMPLDRLFGSTGPTALSDRRIAVKQAGNYLAPVKKGA